MTRFDLCTGVHITASRWALLVLLLTALSGLVPARALQQDSIPADVEQSIRSRVDYGYNQSIVVGIVDADGTRFYGYGETAVDGGQAPDRNTVFEIGSISKVFTSLLLAEMVERGEVSLDDPIEKYLPEEVVAPTRNGTSITLRDLATQTSGLPRLPANLAPADPENPYADYSVQQLYQALSEYTLGRDIGSQYEYSNLGVGLLGHILELRSGMSYDELVQQRISSVLGLEDTRIPFTPEMRQRLAPGHSGRLAVKNWDIPTLAGAGALRSDAEDMLRFLAANLGLEQTPLLPAMRLTQQPLAETGSPNLQIGLGWHILDANGKQIVWHNGGTGGYRSFAGFVPAEGRGVVVLTNSNVGADDLGFHVLNPAAPLAAVEPTVQLSPAVLARYEGKYVLPAGPVFDVTIEQGQLFAALTGQGKIPLLASSETEFLTPVVDARISFNRDDRGNVTALVLHQGGQEQIAQRRP